MTGKTAFRLTYDEIEGIYREGWRAGANFDGDFSDELGAAEVENESWIESVTRRGLWDRQEDQER